MLISNFFQFFRLQEKGNSLFYRLPAEGDYRREVVHEHEERKDAGEIG